MIRKILFSAAGLCLIGAILFGLNASAQKNNQVGEVIGEINNLTDFAITTLGENPSLEDIRTTQRFLEENKPSIKEKLGALKLSELERTNPERASEIRECFDGSTNKFVAIYQKILTKWYADLSEVNRLREQSGGKNSGNSYAERLKIESEIAARRKAVETNIELLNALNETTETYKSIFTE